MFCLWKTLKAYMQKPMCPWEAPNSKLLTVCQKYGPELLCWGNIWLQRLANVGQLAFSFQASFSTAFLHSYSHAKRSLEIAKLQVPRRSERARISQPYKVPCHGKLILGMSLFCSLWEGRRRHENCYIWAYMLGIYLNAYCCVFHTKAIRAQRRWWTGED